MAMNHATDAPVVVFDAGHGFGPRRYRLAYIADNWQRSIFEYQWPDGRWLIVNNWDTKEKLFNAFCLR
jgi:hypothetical protein